MSINTFTPSHLPNIPIKWEKLIGLIGSANSVIGRFDEHLKLIGHPHPLFSILKIQEAVWSMESQRKDHLPRPTVEDVLVFEACGMASDKKKKSILEILQYRIALKKVESLAASSTISLKAIRDIHAIIKKHSRASKSDIGHFRNRQNWIGPIGCTIEDAYFYPPPAHIVKDAMRNLEKYIHYKEKDILVQLGIIFAQLLIIHPFMDGNGRISRLLIPLLLYKKKLIAKPLFFMSKYFQKNRLAYLENLFNISMQNNWEGWIHFFLLGIIDEGKQNIERLKAIHALYLQLEDLLAPYKTTQKILDSLFTQAIFTEEQFSAHAELPKATAQKVLKDLKSKSLIKPLTKKTVKSQNLLTFEKLIRLASN